MKKNLLLIFFVLFAVQSILAQTTILRSLGTNTWVTFANWEKSADGGMTYGAATAAPTSNQGAIIQNGHVITLDASSKSCLNLNIQSGGQIKAGASTFSVRVGTGSTGVGGYICTLQNDGTFGAAGGDQILYEFPTFAAQVTLTGTGLYNFGRIRAIPANLNFPGSAATSAAASASLIVDANLILNTPNQYCFSIPNSTVNTNDVISFTLNSGKSITVVATDSKWENTLMTSATAVNGGKYTYNINGTLDLSSTITGTSAFIPYSNAASAINVNINGTLKLGKLFKADTVAATGNSLGGLYLNIGNGGLVDATPTTSFNVGKTGTNATNGVLNPTGNIFWVVTGTGAIRRTAINDGVSVKFPFGTSITSYTPLTINRPATVAASAVFTANVQNSITNAYTDPTKTVNKQWNIALNSGAADATDILTFSWTTADQAGSFNPAGTVNVYHWNGATYDLFPATVTGMGTAANPYVATVTGITSYSPFIVANPAAPVPLKLVAFNAAIDKNNTVNLNWLTTNELNSKEFAVERSSDSKNFIDLGIVAAFNNLSENAYQFSDINAKGSNVFYYRLKQIDFDGSFTYSKIAVVKIKNTKQLIAYPNPSNKEVNIAYNVAPKNTFLSVYDNMGKLVFKTAIKEGSTQTNLDVSAFVNGIYQVVITDGANTQKTQLVKIN